MIKILYICKFEFTIFPTTKIGNIIRKDTEKKENYIKKKGFDILNCMNRLVVEMRCVSDQGMTSGEYAIDSLLMYPISIAKIP